MKIVGKAKGKAPKAWCLMQDAKTGHYYVDYDGNWPLHGTYDQVLVKVQQAKDELAKQPVRPTVLPEQPFPGHYSWKEKLEDQPQEYQDARKLYDEYQQSAYAASQWDDLELKTHIVPLDYVPVFEDELRFVGYTRGRSSVTMQFEASNGQTVEFGPSGINGLIQGIIDGDATTVFLSGTLEKGIKARFKFAKKGQNVYAELTED